MLREASPGRDVCHNFMGFYTEFDHYRVGADLDVAAWDSYPLGFLEQFWFSDADKAGYARQGEGREIVGYGQGAVAPEGDWKWGQALAPIGAARVERIEADERVRDVATVYVIAGRVTASGSQVKFETLKARLTGGDQAAWAILISASPRGERSGRDQIAAFLRDAGGVDALARRLTATR